MAAFSPGRPGWPGSGGVPAPGARFVARSGHPGAAAVAGGAALPPWKYDVGRAGGCVPGEAFRACVALAVLKGTFSRWAGRHVGSARHLGARFEETL